MISNKVFICISSFFVMGIIYAAAQMFFILPKLEYSDLSNSKFRAQTTMEITGPIRPNIITRWIKFQAQEHPERYDMDDRIVIAQEDIRELKKSNLRNMSKDELYSDSIIVQMGNDANKKIDTKETKKNVKHFPRVRVDLFLESLCPDTHRFVKGPLSKVAHDASLMGFLDLNIYVFGKGKQISVEPKKFQCQHGPNECVGNRVENCVVKYVNPGDTVDIFICLYENGRFDEDTISSCTNNVENGSHLNRLIMECMGGEGDHLLQKAYDKTPRDLKFVPSMRINKRSVIPASTDFRDVLCKEWKGDKPESCP